MPTAGCGDDDEGAAPDAGGHDATADTGDEPDAATPDGDALDDDAAADADEDTEPQPVVRRLDCPGTTSFPFEDQLETDADAYAQNANRREVERANFDLNAHFDVAGNPGINVLVEGRLGVSTNTLRANFLPGEAVSLWTFDEETEAWERLGRTITDADGRYAFDLGTRFGRGLHRTYAVFEAARRCYLHSIALWPEGTQTILTDIDGTLTLSDDELFAEMNDASYVQVQNEGSDRLIQTWSEKGYEILYLSARPLTYRPLTHVWLNRFGFPHGLLTTADNLVFEETARAYKAAFITRVLTEYGWEIHAAYGNAGSDITGYADAGIPKDRTFIIGPEAGEEGTVAILDNDWTDHIDTFVLSYPDAQQP